MPLTAAVAEGEAYRAASIRNLVGVTILADAALDVEDVLDAVEGGRSHSDVAGRVHASSCGQRDDYLSPPSRQ